MRVSLHLRAAALLLCTAPTSSIVAQSECTLPPTIVSLLPNPSLELFDAGQGGCTSRQPGGLPDATNQANCLTDWQRVSAGTTDSWNAFTLPGAPPEFPDKLPQPLPSGTGVAGFWVGVRDSERTRFENEDGSFASSYREYLAACLTDGQWLQRDSSYRLQFQLGFIEPQIFTSRAGGESVWMSSPGPVELNVYGVRECDQLHFGEFYSCPEEAGAEGYELITTLSVDGDPGRWSAVTVDFVSPGSYAGFAIGGSCGADRVPAESEFYRNYYFIDDLILNVPEAFAQPVAGPVAVTGQTICAEEIILNGTEQDGAVYQWYKEGVALSGQTGPELRLTPSPDIDGGYRLQVTTAAGCATTDDVIIQRPVIYDQIPDSVALCRPGQAVVISPSGSAAATYTWSDGSTERYFEVTQPGTYSVMVNTACVQREETFVAVRTDRIAYRYRVTPEVPCRGDTVEVALETPYATRFVLYSLPGGAQRVAIGDEPIRVVAGETDRIQALLITDCGFYFDGIDIPSSPKMNLTAEVRDVNCTGPEGRIRIRDGLPVGSQLSWLSPRGRALATGTPTLSVADTGTYTLVSSAPGYCLTVDRFSVGDNDGFGLDIQTEDVSCTNDGLALAVPVGGTPPYRIEWRTEADGSPLPVTGRALRELRRGVYHTTLFDSAGCAVRESFQIAGPDPLRLRTEATTTACFSATGGAIRVAASGGTPPYRYIVGDRKAVATDLLTELTTGTYAVHVTDSRACRSDTAFTEVWLPDDFRIAIRGDSTLSWGQTLDLSLEVEGTDVGSGRIEWSPRDRLIFTRPAPDRRAVRDMPQRDTEYTATFTSRDGCIRTDTFRVAVDTDARWYLPNAFTPNGDGNNDRFGLLNNRMVVELSALRIFNRWGGLVYEGIPGAAAQWDGTIGGAAAPAGTYVYQGTVSLRTGEEVAVSGSVLLLR